MSALRAGHLRKAPVAAAKVVGGGSSGMRAASCSTDIDFPHSYPLRLVRVLHNSVVFQFPYGGVA